MGEDYSGAIGLAQSVLAFNLAYIALNKFRYQAEIRKMYEQALRMIDGGPEHYRTDLAWKNIENMAEGTPTEPWPDGRMAHWLYAVLFVQAWDRRISISLSVMATFILLFHAYLSLVANQSTSAVMTGTAGRIIGTTVFFALLVGVIVPPLFIASGKYVLMKARRLMDGWLDHIANKARDDGLDQITARMKNAGI